MKVNFLVLVVVSVFVYYDSAFSLCSKTMQTPIRKTTVYLSLTTGNSKELKPVTSAFLMRVFAMAVM